MDVDTKLYHYTTLEGAVSGPALINEIRKDVVTGILGFDLKLSSDHGATWQSLIEVNKEEAHQGSKSGSARAPVESRLKGSLDFIGYLFSGIGVICLLIAVMRLIVEEPKTAVLAGAAGLSLLTAGVLFFAIGEGLQRLAEISNNSR